MRARTCPGTAAAWALPLVGWHTTIRLPGSSFLVVMRVALETGDVCSLPCRACEPRLSTACSPSHRPPLPKPACPPHPPEPPHPPCARRAQTGPWVTDSSVQAAAQNRTPRAHPPKQCCSAGGTPHAAWTTQGAPRLCRQQGFCPHRCGPEIRRPQETDLRKTRRRRGALSRRGGPSNAGGGTQEDADRQVTSRWPLEPEQSALSILLAPVTSQYGDDGCLLSVPLCGPCGSISDLRDATRMVGRIG